MKKFVAVFGLMLIAAIGYAQNYHITDFLPDSLKTWQVYGTVSSSLSGTDRDEETKDTGVNESKEKNEESTTGITPTVYFKYWQVTPRRELSVYSYLRGSYSKSTDDDDDEDYLSEAVKVSDGTGKNLEGQIYGLASCTEYLFCQNRLGLSLEAYISLNKARQNLITTYNDQYSSTDRINKSDNDYLSSSENFRLSPGVVFGRTYNGDYAAKAAEIMDELQKQNLLTRDLTATEFKEFSRRIMNRVASYHYDSRIKNIEALQDIIGYLESIGVLKELDIASFVTINDVYLFSPARNIRSFGTQFYIRNDLSYSPSTDKNNYEYWYRRWYVNNGVFEHDSLTSNYKRFTNEEYRNQYHSSGYEIGFNRYIVKSWHLWYNYGAYFSHSFTPRRHTYKNKVEYDDILSDTSYVQDESSVRSFTKNRRDEISVSATFNYQFNSRSYLSVPLNIYYTASRQRVESVDNYIRYYTSGSINAEFTYFLTPIWSLTSSGGIEYYRYRYSLDKRTLKNTDGSFSLSMTYYW